MELDEEIPFLEEEKRNRHPELGSERSGLPKCPRKQQRWLWISVVTNAILLKACLFLVFLLAFKQTNDDTSTIPEPYSPVNNAIEYEYRRIVANDTTMVGKPNPAWESRMSNLLNNTLLSISQTELDLANTTSIPLKSSTRQYAGGLGVAHNIHCVKKLKQFLYFHHFYPEVEIGSSHYEYLQYHADHCLNFLLQSMMCHMDTSLYTLVWVPGEDGETMVVKHREPGVQKCVNWDKVQGWMRERAVSSEMMVGPGG